MLDTIELTSDYLKYAQPPLFLKNLAGRFTQPGSGAEPLLSGSWAGRGAAFGDLDNDGDIDVVVSNCGQPAYVLRNEAAAGANWIALTLVGTRSNRDALGARVRIVSASGSVQHYTAGTASSYLAASDKRIVAGLGRDAAATLIEIKWPSGAIRKLQNVRAKQQLVVREGD